MAPAGRPHPGVSAASAALPNATAGGLSTAGTTIKEWSLGFGVTSYEVDLFGQVQALTQQAFESALADEETRRSAQISLISEVADGY